MLHQRGGRGHVRVVRGARRDDDQIEILRPHLRLVERCSGGLDTQRARRLLGRGDAPFADARPRANPLVRGVDQLGQLRVGHDPFGQVLAPAGDAHVALAHTCGSDSAVAPSPGSVSTSASPAWTNCPFSAPYLMMGPDTSAGTSLKIFIV